MVPFDSVSVIVPEVATPEPPARKILAPTEVTPGLNEIVSASLMLFVPRVILPPDGCIYKPLGALAVHVGEPAPKLPVKSNKEPCA